VRLVSGHACLVLRACRSATFLDHNQQRKGVNLTKKGLNFKMSFIYLQPFQFFKQTIHHPLHQTPGLFFFVFLPHIDEDGGQDFLNFPA
jgi:hypothetical protein